MIPWRPEEEIPAPKFGNKKPTRKVPRGIVPSRDEFSVIYDEEIRFETEIKATIVSTNLECMWCCPEPDMGPAVVCVNLRLRGSDKWIKLSYSMRESAIRYK